MCGTFPSLERGVPLLPGERLDDLQCGGYRLIQRPDAFRFGTDSVLLADFAAPRPRTRAVDLGCGTGAVDVYKRQVCRFVPRIVLLQRQQRRADRIHAQCVGRLPCVPVSYTHLDVYKRQPLTRFSPPSGRATMKLCRI